MIEIEYHRVSGGIGEGKNYRILIVILETPNQAAKVGEVGLNLAVGQGKPVRGHDLNVVNAFRISHFYRGSN